MEIQNHRIRSPRARGEIRGQHPTAAAAPPDAWTGLEGAGNGGVSNERNAFIAGFICADGEARDAEEWAESYMGCMRFVRRDEDFVDPRWPENFVDPHLARASRLLGDDPTGGEA